MPNELMLIFNELEALMIAEGMLRRQKLKRKETLLRPGMHADEVHLICSGMAKMYWKNMDNEELIFAFCCEDEVLIVPDRFVLGGKNERVYIEMTEDSEIYTINKTQLGLAYQQFEEMHQLGKLVLASLNRKRDLHTQVLQEPEGSRYGFFCALFPELKHRLSEKDTCSFLGISKTTLFSSKRFYLLKDSRKK
ncbi:CRP-like cAMP-binding protein [Pedobacter africanus]|uniref:CRP-like cAMP-binding protein n=1 Tax=Pedobacter africanus TaxID=151894 RepID=A0ACC6L4X5_9SPHI|nr:cyclic nucleotide-binding domain-containing protein [Pedobacter africanus]MDR6786465.1 CRP-like cAMP-binding protein [Pedobacter africanus]